MAEEEVRGEVVAVAEDVKTSSCHRCKACSDRKGIRKPVLVVLRPFSAMKKKGFFLDPKKRSFTKMCTMFNISG